MLWGYTKRVKAHDLVFIDTEASGLDVTKHELLEVAVIRVSQDWESGTPEFVVVDEWVTKIIPEHIETADPASLRVNGYTVNNWKNAVPLRDALQTFSEKTKDAIMVAHNVSFDAEFIDTALAKHSIPNTMHYHRLDTVSMAHAVLKDSPDTTRYSLGELCKRFGIVNKQAHTALSDSRATFELFKKLLAL